MSDRITILAIFLFLITTTNLYAQKNELWGMTSGGYHYGTIFKTDSVGEHMELVYAFGDNGVNPYNTSFVQYTNGKLYGVTNGGKFNQGAIFKFDPYNKEYEAVHYFTGGLDGANPIGKLLLANNGKFYGTCKYGGEYNQGIIYEFNPNTNEYKIIFTFKDNTTGKMPVGGLIQATNGKLYGMTLLNYSSYNNSIGGTLYEFDLANDSIITKVYFSNAYLPGVNYGRTPAGDLLQINNGHLYGMTTYGGTSFGGVIFDYDISLDTLIVKHNFSDTLNFTNKINPKGTLIQASNGKLYGFTKGTLFEFDPITNQYITKVFLKDTLDAGAFPIDRLLEVTNGKLYGVCTHGGLNDKGIIFEYNTQNNQCVKRIDFDGLSKGANPSGGLFLLSNGILYGMTTTGGIDNSGVVFEYNYLYTQIFSKDYDFRRSVDGKNPNGSLLLASNGKFYGMTTNGGVYQKGVIFEYDPATFTFTKKFDFNDTLGAHPYGSLIEASNGKLYGTTHRGGSINEGTVFEYNMGADSIRVIQSLNGFYGTQPYGDLVQATPTKLYGIASNSCYNHGSVFEYDLVADTVVLGHCLNYNSGFNPQGSFIKYDSTKIYGLTVYGGAGGRGTVLQYDLLNDSMSVATVFTGANGASPKGSLCKTASGRVFGVTSNGGSNGYGVLFELQYGNIGVKKSFSAYSDGAYSKSTLMQASNGKLYGMTESRGHYDEGTLFEYNISTNVLTVKHHFHMKYGSYPTFTKLVERDACGNATYSSFTTLACNSYTSPSGKIWTQTGIYKDTLSNRFYCDSIITINLIISHVDTSVSISGATLSANFIGGSYQWLDCDNVFTPIMGATAQSFTPSANGHYAVMVAGNGCVDTSGCYAVTKVGIIENTFGDRLQAFPNPTSGEFSIDLGKEYQEVQLWLRDATGHLVNHSEYRNCNRIDYTIDAPTGLYFLELRNSKGNRVLIKIMKL